MSRNARRVEDDVLRLSAKDDLDSIIAQLREGAEVDDEHERLALA